MMKEKERLTPFQRLRDRHENFDNFCFWLEGHWEDVALYMQHRSQLLVGSKKMVTGYKSNLANEDAIEYAGSDSGYDGDAY